MNRRQKSIMVASIVAAIVIVDQVVKIMVKTHMYIGEEIPLIGNWCKLHFIENAGFAFGTAFGGEVGKVLLTLFRVVASVAIGWYIVRLLRGSGRTSMVACLAVLFAGAVGNIIDSTFYGLIFSESHYRIATLFPPEGGYAPLLQGKVVDMFYFPLFEFNWPQWVPFVGGNHFVFFSAIFNVADVAITVGVFWLVIELFLASRKDDGRTVEEKK